MLAEIPRWPGWVMVVWTAAVFWPIWYGMLLRRRLADIEPLPPGAPDAPKVSIIVPACNEEAEIESALRSMLAIDYPQLEVIAINDRSTDATGRIMDDVARNDSRCRVVHIDALPAGWLGKNHANRVGAGAATGQYLLFTDGDVKFRPEILRHAMGFVLGNSLDHLTLLPDPGRGSFLEGVLMTWFVLCFHLYTRAPLAKFRWAKWAFVGVGAFNLVRRGAYDAIGGHGRLRMEVADDVMLGKLLKTGGFSQDVLIGRPLVHVRWQTGAWGIIRGLEKNAFAGVRFSVGRVAAAAMLGTAVAALPLGLALPGPWWIMTALLLLMLAGTCLFIGRELGYGPLVALCYPLGSLMFTFLLVRSAAIVLRRGGITWRGTFYPLAELKRGVV